MEGEGKPHHSHGLAEDEDKGLVGHGDGAREEEEGQGDVEEREGGEDGLGGDERHDGRLWDLAREKEETGGEDVKEGDGEGWADVVVKRCCEGEEVSCDRVV